VDATIRYASAPVSFGVDEVQVDAWRPGPDMILDVMVDLGFTGTELGPFGYLGETPAVLRERLRSRRLSLVGSFQALRFSRPEHFEADLADLMRVMAFLKEATPDDSQPLIILSDAIIEPDRLAFAGRIPDFPDTWLSADRQKLLTENIHRAARAVQDEGLEAVVHPHGGTYIETEAEVRALADAMDGTVVGLCLDTGHARFGHADPVRLLEDYRPLVRHIHIKDCSMEMLDTIAREELGLEDAVARGAFCELGSGDSGVGEVIDSLLAGGYEGWLVVEQDRLLQEGATIGELRDSQARNVAYLRDRGAWSDPA
jgi:inosose dehydratase